MAFAKLSGSLLESDARPARAPEQPTVPAPPRAEEQVATTAEACDILERLARLAEAAPLYDSLWEFIRTGDEQGVARVVAELVRAGRSISEISDVVDSLSKLARGAGPEAGEKPAAEPPEPSAAPEFVEAPPDAYPDEMRDADTICADDDPVVASLGTASDRVPEPATDMPSQAEYETATWREPLQNAAEPAIAAELGSTYVGERIPARAAAICSPNPARPKFSARTYAGAALAALLAIAGAGAFLMSEPGAKQVGIATALPAEAGAELSLNGAGPRAGGVTQPGADSLVPRPAEAARTAPVPPPASPAPAAMPSVPPAAPLASPTPPMASPAAKPTETAAVAAPIVALVAATTAEGAATPAASPPTGSGRDRAQPKPAAPETDATVEPASALPTQPDQSAPGVPIPPTTAAPKSLDRAASIRAEAGPVVANLEMPKPLPAVMPPSSSAPPFSAPVPAVIESKEPAAMPVDTAPLLERGDRLFGTGDVASARLFYQRAAEAGNAQAALRLGETYDRAFLVRAQLRVAGDHGLAMFWYGRARDLGAGEADILLNAIQSR